MSEVENLLSFEDFREQRAVWESLRKNLSEGTFVHSYLICGEKGTGKRSLAKLTAAALLCRNGNGCPCGKCSSCVQVMTENHPDLIILQPGIPIAKDTEAGRTTIPVEDIRELIRQVNVFSFEGGRRAVIVRDAHKMTPAAQNAFLKTLEEPPEGTVFFLLTDMPGSLLTTIISRCRRIDLHPWSDEKIYGFLHSKGIDDNRIRSCVQEAGGSFSEALRIAGDTDFWERRKIIIRDFLEIPDRSTIASVSSQWKEKKTERDELLNTLEGFIRNSVCFRFGNKDETILSDLPRWWKIMTEQAPLRELTDLLELIPEIREKAASSVNWQMLCEQLLLKLVEEKKKWQG